MKNSTRGAVFACLGYLLLSGAMPGLSQETWTNRAGKSIQAKFLSFGGDHVRIQRSDGRVFDMALSSLDEASRKQAYDLAIVNFRPWTAAEMKKFWLNNPTPLPGTLDPEYHNVKKANEETAEKILSGYYDDMAVEVALQTNISELNALGRPDLAAPFEKRLEQVRLMQANAKALDELRLIRQEIMLLNSSIRDREVSRSLNQDLRP